jgi:hypothetical protein
MEKQPLERSGKNLNPVQSVQDCRKIDLSNIQSADLNIPTIKSVSNVRGGRMSLPALR